MLKCPQCDGRMSVIAIIRNPESIQKIIACMKSKGSQKKRIPAPRDTSPSLAPAAGRKITTGMVLSLQTFGEYAAWMLLQAQHRLPTGI